MIQAALIDLDGFLVNSNELTLEANRQYFGQFGFDFTDELHRQSISVSFRKWITTIVDLGKSGEEIVEERDAIFYRLAEERLALLDGAEDFLHYARSCFATALVSSAKQKRVDFAFSRLGLARYFDEVITREMVEQGKPNPACYLLAMQKLGMTAAQCMAFEDGPTGVLAAKRAGLRVIAVPDSYVPDDPAYQQADIVVHMLPEVVQTLETAPFQAF